MQNAIADTLNNAEWTFALAECLHIGGFAVGIGSIALVDLRMLNLGLRKETAARILKYTEPWTMVALVFVVFSGLMLFLAQPEIYLQRAPYVLNERFMFLLKMSLLATAVLYNFTVHRRVAKMDNPPPALSKLVAAVSLVLWVSIVFGGIFIGFLQ